MGYNYGINMKRIPDGGLSEWYTLVWYYSFPYRGQGQIGTRGNLDHNMR